MVSLCTMAHGGSELFVHTGLLAPIFEASFYLMLFRAFLFQVFLWYVDDCNVNSHLASRIPASQGPDQLAVKAGDLGIASGL